MCFFWFGNEFRSIDKKIIIHQEGTEADFLEACADKVIVYEDFEDLRENLKKLEYYDYNLLFLICLIVIAEPITPTKKIITTIVPTVPNAPVTAPVIRAKAFGLI